MIPSRFILSQQFFRACPSPPDGQALKATDKMCYHCFDTLIDDLQDSSKDAGWRPFRNHKAPIPGFVKDLPDAAVECPLFITWDKQKVKGGGFPGKFLRVGQQQTIYVLRGCIGSLSPKPLATAVGEYALTSALRDRRFHPVKAEEISQLRVAVSLLVQYEPCNNCFDWIVGKHGILIKFWSQSAAREYSATYLPEVAKEQNWDQKAAVTSLIRKSGYSGKIDDELFAQIDCTRYQSSKLRMTFEEYMMIRKEQTVQSSSGENSGGTSSLPSTEPSSASSSVHQIAVETEPAQEEEEEEEEGADTNNEAPKQYWNTCNNL